MDRVVLLTRRLLSTTNHYPLSKENSDILKQIIRVNQAGELGANYIYKGQIKVLGNDIHTGPMLRHMLDQEKVHLHQFNQLVPKYRARPSLLAPFWKASGFAIGALSAYFNVHMALTKSVETVIGEHYNDQIRTLVTMLDHMDTTNHSTSDLKDLIETLRKFRDEELEHLDTAHENNADDTHPIIQSVFKAGCKAVIEIAKRV